MDVFVVVSIIAHVYGFGNLLVVPINVYAEFVIVDFPYTYTIVGE
jgi:hypothetical protein